MVLRWKSIALDVLILVVLGVIAAGITVFADISIRVPLFAYSLSPVALAALSLGFIFSSRRTGTNKWTHLATVAFIYWFLGVLLILVPWLIYPEARLDLGVRPTVINSVEILAAMIIGGTLSSIFLKRSATN